jgi:hypothetical protein
MTTPAEEKKNIKIGCAALIIIFIAVIAGWAFSSNDTGKEPSRLDAYVASQQFVEKQLKAPSSAKFPVFDNSMVVPLGNNRFKVAAYVDAQNSFGAIIRTSYTCTVKNTDGDNWQLESIDLSN